MKRILLIGRWSPFHNGHKHLVDSFLKAGESVCIAIRDTKELYPVSVRMEMIRAVYPDEEAVKIIYIPDIKGVAVGRDVGYFYVDLPEGIKKISGTKIREGLSNEMPEKAQKVADYYIKKFINKQLEPRNLYTNKDSRSVMEKVEEFNRVHIHDKNSHGGNFEDE